MTATCWDAFSFIRTSFARWLRDWSIGSEKQLAFIEKMKEGRSTFAAADLPRIRRYNQLELELLQVAVEELLRRIQDIRTSERRFYQKITDIYSTSIDYDPTAEASISFFKTVQNKMHWAITGQTAAEIIRGRADSAKPNMGLTNWRGAKVRKEDVVIAKNYLSEPELAALNNLVEQYLIFAEGQAMRRIPMRMGDWIAKLDGFLRLNDRGILTHAGKISHELALSHAEQEYDAFHGQRIAENADRPDDFEKSIQQLPAAKPKRKKKGGKR